MKATGGASSHTTTAAATATAFLIDATANVGSMSTAPTTSLTLI